jgi:hypothetical protein
MYKDDFSPKIWKQIEKKQNKLGINKKKGLTLKKTNVICVLITTCTKNKSRCEIILNILSFFLKVIKKHCAISIIKLVLLIKPICG